MARSWFTAFLSALVLLFVFSTGLRRDDSATRMSDARLPDNAQPHSYQLNLRVDPNLPRFSGTVTISVALRKTANQILMHGRQLNVTRIEALLPGGRRVGGTWKQISESGLARIDFDDVLPDNRFTIEIDYDAAFGQELTGLYRLQVDQQNVAFSQFESTDARSAFPCFDEPRFKTPFRIQITAPNTMDVVSNGAVKSITAADADHNVVLFNDTARLPTYLIAFAIGQFDIVDATAIAPNDWRDHALPLRGIAVRGHGESLNFLLQRTAPLLTALERYFGVQYPFEKIDILVVPDTTTDGMEHAALPTFSERAVAVDNTTAISEQRGIIRHLAHELSHQWFGNLVTMPWWNDLWLKESFATWIAPKAANLAYPDLHFALGNKVDAQTAMFDDARATQRSLRAPVIDDNDIERQYQYNLTYEKGAGILSMFENYIGAKSFQQGLSNYFARHAFGSASADDFMRAVAESTGNFDMPGSLSTFLKQPGVPTLALRDECKGNHLRLHITQSRYLILGSDPTGKATWKIPLCVSTGEGEEHKICRVIEGEQTEWDLPFACDASLMPNANGAGYFYWSLSQPMLDRLLQRLPNMNALEALDVANNVSAAFASGQMDVNAFLSYVPALTRHWHPHVLSRISNDVAWILYYSSRGADREALLRFLRKHFSARLTDISIAPQDHSSLETYFLRANIYPFVALTLEDEQLLAPLIDASKKQFGSDWKQTEKPGYIAPDLIVTALSAVILKYPKAGTDALIYRLEHEQNYYQRLYIFYALFQSKDPYVIAKLHELLDSPSLTADEKEQLVLAMVFSGQHDEHIEWVMANFDHLLKFVAPSRQRAFPLSMKSICDSKQLARERAFYLDQHQLINNGEFDFLGGIEAARQCIALREAQPALAVEKLK